MNEKYKNDFIKAGALAGEVRSFGKSLIKKGASYNEVIAKINQKIIALGARPAFPPQMALNNVAAHFLPEPDQDIILTDQVIKLDVGVCYEGAIGDCAVTVDLSGKHQRLVEAVEAALLAGEKSVEVGRPIREIGRVIDQTISSFGFSTVKNLTGHGLGYYKIHTPPTIPNHDDKSSGVIKPGMTFAMEPFATNGKGFIVPSGKPTLFSFVKNVTATSPIILYLLERIKTFDRLPFAIHAFIGEEFSLFEIRKGLSELIKKGAIEGYAALKEGANDCVVQAENSILVDQSGKVFITTR